jgi:hypothetical protein
MASSTALIRSLGGNAITPADAQNEMSTLLPRAFDAMIFIYNTRAAEWLASRA